MLSRYHQQLRVYLPSNSFSKVWRCGVIHWHNDDPTKHAANKRRYPFGRIRTPKHDAITLDDASAIEFGGKTRGHIQYFAIRKRSHPVTAVLAISAFALVRAKVIEEELCQRFGHFIFQSSGMIGSQNARVELGLALGTLMVFLAKPHLSP